MRIRATVTHRASFDNCQSRLLQHLAARVREKRSAFSGSSKFSIRSTALSNLHAPVPDNCVVCWWPARRLLWRKGVSHLRTIHSNSCCHLKGSIFFFARSLASLVAAQNTC